MELGPNHKINLDEFCFSNLYQLSLVVVYCFKLKSSVDDGGCSEFVVQTKTRSKLSRSLTTCSINVNTMITCAFKSETYFEKKIHIDKIYSYM